MAKVTTRDAFRIVISGTLDLTRNGGPQIKVRVKDAVIAPQQLGDFGWVHMSDSPASSDIENDYERRCQEIVRALRAQQPELVRADVRWDSSETCSYCGYAWAEFTAEDAERYPEFVEPIGTPQCCGEAQAEFVAAQTGVA